MKIVTATSENITQLSALNQKWQKGKEATASGNGYVGALFSADTFAQLIDKKQVVIAMDEQILAGYYLVNNVSKNGVIGLHQDIVDRLRSRGTIAQHLRVAVGAQVIVDTPYMGTGLAKAMLLQLAENIRGRFDYMFGTIAKDNPRSLNAHKRIGIDIVGEDDHLYYILYHIPVL